MLDIRDEHIGLLAVGNLSIEVLQKWATAITPVLSVLVSVGQIAVAVFTVLYIIRKIKVLKAHQNGDTK